MTVTPVGYVAPWNPIDNSSRVVKVVMTLVPEKYGVFLTSPAPDLYVTPVAWVFMRTFYPGTALRHPAVPVYQQEVCYAQPIADEALGMAVDFILSPGCEGTFEIINL